MAKSYAVKEMFRTIQGEGHHAGTPAVFIRFAGCNMWSGIDADRERDAVRNEASCPRWCDTDFVGGDKLTSEDIGRYLEHQDAVPLVVLTGGEPMLQVDNHLLDVIYDAAPEARVAIETNGTVRPRFDYNEALPERERLWITCSPKRGREHTILARASELKLVWPAYDPDEWLDYRAHYFYLQPQADQAILNEVTIDKAVKYVTANYRWRLSLQTHKILGVR